MVRANKGRELYGKEVAAGKHASTIKSANGRKLQQFRVDDLGEPVGKSGYTRRRL